MNLPELFLIAIGLSMDAFAVSICTGLVVTDSAVKRSLTAGLYFGCFQAIMPVIGYILATQFADKIIEYDHWVAFVLLAFIGGKMIIESFKNEEKQISLKPMHMLTLAFATSVDALATGISFAFLNVNIILAALLIGTTTFTLSIAGVNIGRVFGAKFKTAAERLGGIILVLMGLKILIEHIFG